jgi:hypothetical protein
MDNLLRKPSATEAALSSAYTNHRFVRFPVVLFSGVPKISAGLQFNGPVIKLH